MAYDMGWITGQINQYKDSNPALAYALYNGFSGMGGGVGAGGYAGGVDTALRGLWGDDVAKQWVNNNDTKYGNTSFDPSTGKWAGMGQAAGMGGTLAGYDPTQYGGGGSVAPYTGSITPTGYGSGAAGFGAAPAAGGAPTSRGGASTGLPGAPGMPTAPAGTGGFDPGTYTAPTRGAGASSPFDFFDDAGYKFAQAEGMKGIQGSAAANGSLQSGKTLRDLASFKAGQDGKFFGEAFDRFDRSREFDEGKYRSDRDFGRGTYESDRGFGEGQFRDRRDFGESSRRYDQEFGEGRRRYDQGFGESQRRDARDFDYRSGLDDRDFDWAVQKDNRNFGYGADMGDRNWMTSVLQGLSGQGLAGSQGSASLAQWLAGMQSGNTMAGAGAGAAGTMGGANGMNAMISQIMQYLQSQQMMGAFGRNP